MGEKRFTDTGLNKQPWFRKLKPKMKCAIRFIFDECDKAGVWVIDMETLSYFVGEDVTLEELFEKINSDKENRIEKFGSDKIFIPGFVAFQYGELSEDCRPHKQIIALLKKYNLYDRVLNRVSDTLQEKTGQEKDKDKDKEENFGKSENLLDETALLPKMANVFKEKHPNYVSDTTNDFPALKQIAHFICKQTGISFQPRDGDVQKIVLDNWAVISECVSQHKLYSNHSLQQISKYIQSISTEIRNESTGNKASGKPGSKITGSKLNKAFDEFYSKGKSVANTG